ncbi:MAG: MFS transporter [Chloroflexota bacterium]
MIQRLLPAHLGRDFRWLWSSAALSNLGDGLRLAAGPLLVTTVSRDPLAVGLSVAMQHLPWVLIGLPAGAIIDRVDRRRLSIVVNVLRAIVLAALSWSILTDTLDLAILYVALFLIGTAETFADNAASALIATRVPKEHLGIANARLIGTSVVMNQLAGPPIGAFLFGMGIALPFAADAILALAAAGLLSRMIVKPWARPEGSPRHIRQEIAEGLTWLWRHRPVRTLALTIFAFNVTFWAPYSVLVLLATERLGLDAFGFGLLITVSAVGGLIGSASYGWLERRFALSTLMRVGLLLETVTHFVLATTTSPLVAGATMTLFGIHAVVWGTTSTTVRQRAVPAALMGRVTSVYMLGAVGGGVIGSVIGGLIAQRFGITAPFWFGFAGSALILVLIWRELVAIAHAPPAADEEPGNGPRRTT